MEFKQIVMQRYATKLFDGRKLPQGKVDELLEVIRYAPSSFNIQPWKIIVIGDKETKEKLAPVSWNQKQITSCSHLLVFCANRDIAGNIGKLEKLMTENGANPEDIRPYIKAMRDFEKSLSDAEKLSWAQRQAYLALANALNGAKSLGFDSCPMEGFDPASYSKILKLPSNIIPVALCPVGYAADKQKQKLRFTEDYVLEMR